MSTTVSIGVWSVTVIGAISKIFFNFNGGGPKFCAGVADVNNTVDMTLIPSIIRFAFSVFFFQVKFFNEWPRHLTKIFFCINLPIAKFKSRLKTKPTKY